MGKEMSLLNCYTCLTLKLPKLVVATQTKLKTRKKAMMLAKKKITNNKVVIITAQDRPFLWSRLIHKRQRPVTTVLLVE